MAALFVLLEATTALLYHNPRLLPFARPNPIFIAFRIMYATQAPLVQWACSRYSDEIGNYTLRPGRCTHTTTEFSVAVEANSMGLRDTEDALAAPEVVVIGPSFAMGWGVGQDETLARHIARMTGLRVLNAAIAGYGLRQSLSLLRRLDRSKMRYLVIVYFLPQDTRNIRQAIAQGASATDYHLDRYVYDEAVRHYVATHKPLVPGKYLYTLVRTFLTMSPERWTVERAPEERLLPASLFETAGADFLEMLRRAGDVIGDSRIVLAPSTPACRRNSDRLADSVAEAMAAGEKRFPNSLLMIKAGAELDPSYCFTFDNHLNARGHLLYGRKIAEAILQDLGLRASR